MVFNLLELFVVLCRLLDERVFLLLQCPVYRIACGGVSALSVCMVIDNEMMIVLTAAFVVLMVVLMVVVMMLGRSQR